VSGTRPSITGAAWSGFLASLGAVALAGAAWCKLQPPEAARDAWEAMRAERAALVYATDTRVAAARATAVRSWSAPERKTFLSNLAEEWIVREEANRVVLAARTGELERWPDFLGKIRALEQERSLAIESLEIATTGTGAHRRFAAITIAIRFVGMPARAETGPAQATVRPPRGESAQAALPRQLGRVTALRRAADLRRASGRSARSPLRSVPTLRGPGPEYIQTNP
jgi:hypothetical protein